MRIFSYRNKRTLRRIALIALLASFCSACSLRAHQLSGPLRRVFAKRRVF